MRSEKHRFKRRRNGRKTSGEREDDATPADRPMHRPPCSRSPLAFVDGSFFLGRALHWIRSLKFSLVVKSSLWGEHAEGSRRSVAAPGGPHPLAPRPRSLALAPAPPPPRRASQKSPPLPSARPDLENRRHTTAAGHGVGANEGCGSREHTTGGRGKGARARGGESKARRRWVVGGAPICGPCPHLRPPPPPSEHDDDPPIHAFSTHLIISRPQSQLGQQHRVHRVQHRVGAEEVVLEPRGALARAALLGRHVRLVRRGAAQGRAGL